MKKINKKLEPIAAQVVNRFSTLQTLIGEANKNSKKLGELNAFLNDNPDLGEKLSLLASSIKSQLFNKLVSDPGTQAVVRSEVEGIIKKLSNAESTPLEDLLLDAIAMCWLRVQYAENYRTAVMGAGNSYREAEFADKMLTQAYNRYLKVIESLAKLRKMNQPKRGDSLDRSLKAVKLLNSMSSGQ